MTLVKLTEEDKKFLREELYEDDDSIDQIERAPEKKRHSGPPRIRRAFTEPARTDSRIPMTRRSSGNPRSLCWPRTRSTTASSNTAPIPSPYGRTENPPQSEPSEPERSFP